MSRSSALVDLNHYSDSALTGRSLRECSLAVRALVTPMIYGPIVVDWVISR